VKDFCRLLRSYHPCNREEGEKILIMKVSYLSDLRSYSVIL